MKYTSTITSKGTITIAAPLRKLLGLVEGQKVELSLNEHNQVVVSKGTTIEDFEKVRSRIFKSIPEHKKGLQGQALRDAAAKAWTSNYSE